MASSLAVYGYAISTQSKHPSEAWKLISFLTRETAQAAIIQYGQYAPSRQNLLDSKIFLDFPGPQAVHNFELIASLPSARLLPQVAYWKQAKAIFNEEMLSLITDKKASARAMLERLQARLDELRLLSEPPKKD